MPLGARACVRSGVEPVAAPGGSPWWQPVVAAPSGSPWWQVQTPREASMVGSTKHAWGVPSMHGGLRFGPCRIDSASRLPCHGPCQADFPATGPVKPIALPRTLARVRKMTVATVTAGQVVHV